MVAAQSAHGVAAALVGLDLEVGWIASTPVAQADLVWAKFVAAALASAAIFAVPSVALLIWCPALAVFYLPAVGCAGASTILHALWYPQQRKRGDPAVLSPAGGGFFIVMLITLSWTGALGLAYWGTLWCLVPLGLALAAMLHAWLRRRPSLTEPHFE